jgi:hypothetical protein
MIARIMADNQYRIDAAHETEITRLDDQLVAAAEANDASRFQAALDELIQYVRSNGQVVPDEELVASDVMIPAADMTIHEAQTVLQKAPVHPATGDDQP